MVGWKMGRKNSLFIGFFLIFLAAVTAAHAAPTPPGIYEGVLEIDTQRVSQSVQLALIPYLRPTENGETANLNYVAILTLGSGYESTALHFSSVRFNPQTQELMLLPDSVSEGKGKLPTVRLRFASDKSLDGTFLSPSVGLVGKIRMSPKTGLQKPAATLKPLEGLYRGNCGTVLPDSRLVAIHLLASRLDFPAGGVPSEATYGGVNYIGNAVCSSTSTVFASGNFTCAGFPTGVYSTYSGDLTLTDETNSPWQCRRDSVGDKLTCQSKLISSCTLTRTINVETSNFGEDKKLAVAPELNAEPRAVSAVATAPERNACGAWDGIYQGVLTHAATNKQQIVSVRLATHLISGPLPPVRCSIQGSASLIFGSKSNTNEQINTVFPEFEFIPNRPDQVLLPEREGDAILQMRQSGVGQIEGNWYSKRHGFVGNFVAKSSTASPNLTAEPVYGLSGEYEESDPTRGYLLSMSVIPVVAELKSPNPFSALSVIGWHDLRVVRLPIKSAAYDYFANRLVMDTGGVFLVGRLNSEGFRYSMIARRFQTEPGSGEVFLHVRK